MANAKTGSESCQDRPQYLFAGARSRGGNGSLQGICEHSPAGPPGLGVGQAGQGSGTITPTRTGSVAGWLGWVQHSLVCMGGRAVDRTDQYVLLLVGAGDRASLTLH